MSDDRALGGYCLTLHQTRSGRFYVKRSEWWLWGGELVAMNAERVSPYYETREATRAFCMGYATDNPGCSSSVRMHELLGGAA